MPRPRIDLQPPVRVAAPQTQEVRFAAKVGGAKSGLAFINVFGNQSGTTVAFRLFTASSPDLHPGLGNNWLDAGTQVQFTAGVSGTKTMALTTLGEVLRWDVSGLNNTVDFSIAVFLYDA